MSKPTKLSHSSCSRYQSCPKSWEYHYKEKFRPKYQSAALLFGSALDNAINALLKKTGRDAHETFEYNWKFAFINGKKEFLPENNKVVYANSDYDKDILKPEDINELLKKTGLKTKEEVFELFKQLSETKKHLSWDKLSEDDKKLFNYYNWLSLRRKGHLMIKAYESEVAPRIKKVHAVQKYVELKNDEGDKIVGYIDLICDWEDQGTIVFDLKTSSIHYEEDSVLTSPQLTLYMHAIGKQYKTRKCGYIVLNKHIDKNRKKICTKCNYDGSSSRHKTCPNEIGGTRCNGEYTETVDPKVNIQIITDLIPERTEEIVLDNFAEINDAIKSESFPRNFSSCVKPWGKCEFFNLCYKNDSSDLVKEEKKKKGD